VRERSGGGNGLGGGRGVGVEDVKREKGVGDERDRNKWWVKVGGGGEWLNKGRWCRLGGGMSPLRRVGGGGRGGWWRGGGRGGGGGARGVRARRGWGGKGGGGGRRRRPGGGPRSRCKLRSLVSF